MAVVGVDELVGLGTHFEDRGDKIWVGFGV